MSTTLGLFGMTSIPRQVFEGDWIVEEIRRHAYQLYVRRGKQDGWDREDWLTAEDAILMKYAVLRRSFKSKEFSN
jgi:Protein of unknown function (DUF2934)